MEPAPLALEPAAAFEDLVETAYELREHIDRLRQDIAQRQARQIEAPGGLARAAAAGWDEAADTDEDASVDAEAAAAELEELLAVVTEGQRAGFRCRSGSSCAMPIWLASP